MLFYVAVVIIQLYSQWRMCLWYNINAWEPMETNININKLVERYYHNASSIYAFLSGTGISIQVHYLTTHILTWYYMYEFIMH